jgi:hypothetical protein
VPDVIFFETILMVVVPIVAGMALLRMRETTPAIGEHPFRTAILLFVLLVIATALLSPGGDLVTPTIGGVVSAAVSCVVLVTIRRETRARPV